MGKCKDCGEWVNWDDPNIHYGGHTCKQKIETQKEVIKSKTSEDNRELKIYILAENLKKEVKLLKETLSMCDPRENYGEGMVCQFCRAKDNEEHKLSCVYLQLTAEW